MRSRIGSGGGVRKGKVGEIVEDFDCFCGFLNFL